MRRFVQRNWNVNREYWDAASRWQKTLFISGSVLFISMLVHGAALLISGGSIHGPTSFRKAMTFAETGWLTCWAIGWLLPLIRLRRLERWLVVGGALLFALGETTLFSVQVWRGVPSHYNVAAPFDAALFGTSGVVALIFLLATLVLLQATLRPHPELASSLLLAIRSGTGLLLIGLIVGMVMIFNSGGIWVGATRATHLLQHGFDPQPAGTVGGDLVLLHAIGVHGLNIVPLAAWLLGYTALTERRRTQLTGWVAGSTLALMVISGAQIFRARPLIAIDRLTLALAGLALTLLIGSFAVIGWHIWRHGRHAQPKRQLPRLMKS